eukprot:PDM64367.1 hypothetical protein PRIPAC_52623 [Pristionchus pacificus]
MVYREKKKRRQWFRKLWNAPLSPSSAVLCVPTCRCEMMVTLEEGRRERIAGQGRRGTKERDGTMKELKLLSAGMREIVGIAEGAGKAERARDKGTWREC